MLTVEENTVYRSRMKLNIKTSSLGHIILPVRTNVGYFCFSIS